MKIAVIYWSGTGNTEMMAKAVAEGAGAELFSVSDFSGNIADYDRLAFGCPAMGSEVLEEDEFEPFFTGIESMLSGKKIALFGSYDWGDGETAAQQQALRSLAARDLSLTSLHPMKILQSARLSARILPSNFLS